MEQLSKEEEKKLQQVYDETVSGSKIFEVDGFGLVKVVFPSIEDSRKADYYYSKFLSEAMIDGLATQDEMLGLLEKKGIWTKEHEEKIKELEKEIKDTNIMASKMKTEKSKQQYLDRVNQLLTQLEELRSKRNFFLSNTAENKAEQERIGYLVYRCSYNAETGERLWKTYDEFRKERRQKAVGVIAFNFISLISGLDDRSLVNSPQEEEEVLGGGEENEKSEK
ncbi:MAG: hypothetical protein AB7E08_05635 [Candidatus Omnitrophota bacterium]